MSGVNTHLSGLLNHQGLASILIDSEALLHPESSKKMNISVPKLRNKSTILINILMMSDIKRKILY